MISRVVNGYRWVLVVLFALVGLSVTNSTLADATMAGSEIGKILYSKGQVEISRQDKTITSKRGAAIYQGDSVMTGLESRVLLQFVDGTRTTLGAQTTYRIDTYDWQPAAKSTAVYELVKGVFKTVTGAITRTESHYQVNTPIGSIGIRGTEFWGGYLVPDKVDVLFISGDSIIDVSNRFGTISLLEPGLGTTLSANKAPTEPKRWPQAKVGKAVNTVYWPELYEPPF